MTQLDAAISAAKETTYGTPVTTSKFVEFNSESLKWNPTFPQGNGVRSGSRFPRSARRLQTPVKQQAGGDIGLDLVSKGLGWILQALFGAVVSTQRATTGVYQHNFTPLQGAANDYLPSYTLQKAIPRLGSGTADAYTFPGACCSSMTLDCPNGEYATLASSWVARELRTDIAAAATAYPTPVEPLSFAGGSIVAASSGITGPTTTALATGTPLANIRDFNLTIDNHLDDAGFNAGGGGKRTRPPAIGVGEVKGHVTAEYDSTLLRDAYLAQTTLGLILTLQGFTVIGTGSDVPALSFYVPAIRLEGDVPAASTDGSVIAVGIDWTGLDNLSAVPVTASYVTTDTAP